MTKPNKSFSLYQYPCLYSIAMRIAYGKEYRERYEMISRQFPEAAHVLELCSGDLRLHDVLERRGLLLSYRGVDLAPAAIERAHARGLDVVQGDVRAVMRLPSADVVIMQASLYQFHEEAVALLRRMWQSASRQMIIAEPVKNVSQSGYRFARRLALLLSRTTDGRNIAFRYTEPLLRAAYAAAGVPIHHVAYTTLGREVVVVSFKES
jgi:trans-aconitate methyltransferase